MATTKTTDKEKTQVPKEERTSEEEQLHTTAETSVIGPPASDTGLNQLP